MRSAGLTSTGRLTRSSPAAPGSGHGCRSMRCRPRSAAQALEGVQRDPSVGGQLAPRDGQQPASVADVHGLASRTRRLAAALLRQHAQPREDGADPFRADHGPVERDGRLREHVRDVALLRDDRVGTAVVQVVGRAEEQHALPGNGEAHPHLVVRDRERGRPRRVRGEQDMHPFAQADRRLGAVVGEPADLVDPRSRGVDDRSRRQRDGSAVGDHVGAPDAAAHEPQRRHRRAVDDGCAVFGRGSDVGEGEPAVVGDAVDVEAATAQAGGAQARHHAQRPLRRDEPVQAGAGERRVDGDSGLDDGGPVGAGVVEWEQERHRPDQVRRDTRHQQTALLVCFAHEPHVAQP